MKLRMIMSIFYFLIFFLFQINFSFSQDGGSIFRNYYVHEIKIELSQNGWYDTLINWQINSQKFNKADSLLKANIYFNGQLIENIGFKMKGGQSFECPGFGTKKPFKVDFNYFVKGQKLDGLNSLNLCNCCFDVSYLHDAVAYKIINDFGVEAPRTGFAKLYINNTYFGLYVLIEQINNDFTNKRFGTDEGDLWKTVSSEFKYLGTDHSLYSGMEFKNSYDSLAYCRLIRLFYILTYISDENIGDSLSIYMDIPSVIKSIAVNSLLASRDHTISNSWLYWHPNSNKYIYIPYDYTSAMNNPSQEPFDENSLYWNNTLNKAIIRNKFLRNQYYQAVCELRQSFANSNYLSEFIDKSYELLRNYVIMDINTPITVTDFDSAIYGSNNEYPYFATHYYSGIYSFLNKQNTITDEVLKKKLTVCIANLDKELSISVNPSLILFPNPTYDSFIINIDQINCNAIIIINSIDGILIYSNSIIIEKGQSKIDIQLKQGIYIVSIKANNKLYKLIMVVKN